MKLSKRIPESIFTITTSKAVNSVLYGKWRGTLTLVGIGLMLLPLNSIQAQDNGWEKNQLRMERNVIVEAIASPEEDTRWILGSHAGVSGMRGFSRDGGNVFESEIHGWAVNDVAVIDAKNGWAVGDEGKIYKTEDGWEEWEIIDIGLSSFETLHAVAFTDEDTGWIVGQLGNMFSTTDGGENWEEADNEFEEAFYDLTFLNEEVAWSVGSNGKIIYTDDGGENWNVQSTPVEESLFTVSALDDETVWVAGSSGTILFTQDGGTTWEESTDFSGDVRLADSDFVDENTGWISGYDGTILHTSDGGDTWETQDGVPDVSVRAIEFFDADHGWAAGSAATILETSDGGETWNYVSINNESVYFLDEEIGWAGGRFGQLMHTSDAGQNWQQLSTPVDDSNIEDLKFFNQDTGWAVVRIGQVLRTEDGGENWEEQDHFGVHLDKIDAVDDQTAWIIGDIRSIFHTSDGGETWEEQDDGLIGGSLYDVSFINEDVGYISASSGRVLKTVNGGEVWEEVSPNSDSNLRAVSFVSADTGYVAGSDGVVLKTTNGGVSWRGAGPSLADDDTIMEVEVLNPWVVWARAASGDIIHTRDGGRNWGVQREGTTVYGSDLSAIHFTDEQTGWAVGTDGRILQYSGDEIVLFPFEITLSSPLNGWEMEPEEIEFSWLEGEPYIHHYQFELATDEDFNEVVVDSVLEETTLTLENLNEEYDQYWWRVRAENDLGWGEYSTRTFELETASSTERLAETPQEYSLDQNYPNPFNPVTSIEYQIPESGPVELTIYNTLGQMVATLVSEQQAAGYYSVDFDGSELPSGVYIYRLEAGSFSETQKMMLVK